MPRMFPQLFPLGFTVCHHRKTCNIKILSRMWILDLGRLRKVDPTSDLSKSQNENTTELFQPAAPAGHSSNNNNNHHQNPIGEMQKAADRDRPDHPHNFFLPF